MGEGLTLPRGQWGRATGVAEQGTIPPCWSPALFPPSTFQKHTRASVLSPTRYLPQGRRERLHTKSQMNLSQKHNVTPRRHQLKVPWGVCLPPAAITKHFSSFITPRGYAQIHSLISVPHFMVVSRIFPLSPSSLPLRNPCRSAEASFTPAPRKEAYALGHQHLPATRLQ